jgi:hypothetical protein
MHQVETRSLEVPAVGRWWRFKRTHILSSFGSIWMLCLALLLSISLWIYLLSIAKHTDQCKHLVNGWVLSQYQSGIGWHSSSWYRDPEMLKTWSLGSERNLDDAEEVMGDGTGSCKLRLTCSIDSTMKSFGIQGTASQAIAKLVEGQNNCSCDQHHVFVWFKQQGTNIFKPS